MSVLDAIVTSTRRRLTDHPPDVPLLLRMIAHAPPPRDAVSALSPDARHRNAVIAEVKRVSPSLGVLSADADAVAVASRYADHGAAAISVLTEPERFGGRFEDLAEVARMVPVPALCKDFIVDPRQVLLARAHGASLALLIVAALTDHELASLQRDIEALGMVALVECHDEREVERALAANARIIGVNNRDLASLHIDLAVCERLRPLIPDDRLPIAESGIASPDDVRRLRDSGYHRFLVGSSLMRAADPGALLAALVHETGAANRDAPASP